MNHLHCHIYLRDDDYLREIRAGGSRAETATSCLYLKHRKRIYSYLRTLISKQGAFKGFPDDLVHDSFIIMIEKIQQDESDIRSLEGYWIGIAKLLFLNQLKKDERIVLVSDVGEKYGYESRLQHSLVHDQDDHEKMEAAFMKRGLELFTGRFFSFPSVQKSWIHSSVGSFMIILPAKYKSILYAFNRFTFSLSMFIIRIICNKM